MKLRNRGCGPPPQLKPAGFAPQANPAATRVASRLPAVGWPLAQVIEIPFDPLKPNAVSVSFATSEYSLILARRKEVPQEPRMVAPVRSSMRQVNASFGLLVPPLSAPLGLEYSS